VVVVAVTVVIAVTRMIATVVVAAVPGRVPVIGSAVVHDRRTVPAAVPAAVTPAAATAVHHGADRDSYAEADESRGNRVTGGINRSRIGRHHVGHAVYQGWVVLRHVYDLRIGGLNHDHLRRLLHDFDLRVALQRALGLGLRTQGLYGGHHRRLLIVI